MPNDHQRLKQLYLKYLGKGRRYSYYPHLSHWNGDLTGAQQFEEGEIDLYIHIPFCRKLCTFCGCNVKVTNSPGEALPYVEALGREWEL
ncbi:MAG: coproporphyrinogen III oxidase, partial [Halobacteriovoraceae bacterium]|nr:coproporphyrinogen III oxidase [Halobacteriovoraceae bacterium]